ncbi:MAG: hypothetical protein QNK92_02620 [Amylibacter sp.]
MGLRRVPIHSFGRSHIPQKTTCDDERPVQGYMVTSDDLDAANKAVLADCNANRGRMVRCAVIATVRRKF